MYTHISIKKFSIGISKMLCKVKCFTCNIGFRKVIKLC